MNEITNQMQIKYSHTSIFAASILIPLAAALAGCAGTVATKDVMADGGQYLATNFTPDKLAAGVRAKVETGDKLPDRFKTLRLSYRISTDEEGKKSEITSVTDLTNLGNGYVQSRSEYSKNGVPYRVNLGLSFGDVYRLKTQTLFLGRANALHPVETKELTRLDRGLINPKPGAKYVIESKTGTSVQLANYLTENFLCSATASGPASAISASLTGQTLDLDCDVVGTNNVVVSKMKFAWLSDYGVGIQKEVADSRTRSVYSVTAVEVSR